MKGKISIIGAGHVGMITALSLASKGFEIIVIDKDPRKIEMMNRGIFPIREAGLAELLGRIELKGGSIEGTTDLLRTLEETNMGIICVGTPTDGSGRMNLSAIMDVSAELGNGLAETRKYHTVIVKSTVPPGTTLNVLRPILERRSGGKAGEDFGLGTCPEFLREGTAIRDSLHPDRLIFGVMERRTESLLTDVFRDFDCPKLVKDITTAEMIKMCSNAFLATKISFANEFANLCERLEIDVTDVFEGVGMDRRISPHFFRAGVGFGGSCFAKDIEGTIAVADGKNVDMRILRAVLDVNRTQFERVMDVLNESGISKGAVVSVLGLAFKPGTDDVRETRALPVIEELLQKGVRVRAYDPAAAENFKNLGVEGDIVYTDSCSEALMGSSAAIFLTEWDEFREILESEFTELMKRPLIIDGRQVFSGIKFHEVQYHAIGSGRTNRKLNSP